MSKVRVRLKRSRIGIKKSLRRTLDALGLRRINQERVYNLSPALEGMLKKVNYLIEIEKLEETDEAKSVTEAPE